MGLLTLDVSSARSCTGRKSKSSGVLAKPGMIIDDWRTPNAVISTVCMCGASETEHRSLGPGQTCLDRVGPNLFCSNPCVGILFKSFVEQGTEYTDGSMMPWFLSKPVLAGRVVALDLLSPMIARFQRRKTLVRQGD